MLHLFDRLASARLLSRHRGLIYVSSTLSIVFCVLLNATLIGLSVLRSGRDGGDVVQTFWMTPEYCALGGFGVLFVFIAPWFTLPFLLSGLRPSAERYIFRRDAWLIKCSILSVTSVVTCVVTALCIPGFVLMLSSLGIGSSILWLVGGVPAGAAPLYEVARRLGDRFFASRVPGEIPPLTEFSLLRPQNSRVVNLDVGSLAPRLTFVDSVLRAWQYSAEERAPTSHLIWQFASGSQGAAEVPFARGRWVTSWQGVEYLREQLASFLRILSQDIVCTTSTTRAVDVALESIRPRCIVTSDQEHPSETRLLSLMEAKYQSVVHQVPVVCGSTQVDPAQWCTGFISRVVDECTKRRPDVLVLSHVCCSNGWVLPIAETVREVRKLSPCPWTLVDGAHAVGQMDVDLSVVGADFYVFSGHKWLFGPPALGILALGERPQKDNGCYQRLILETYEALAMRGRAGLEGECTASISLEPLVGLGASLRGLTDPSIDAVWENLRNLRSRFERLVNSAPNIQIVGSPGPPTSSGIANIQGKTRILQRDELTTARHTLERRWDVVTKVVASPPSLRVCLPFYLRADELTYAVKAINAVFA